jgi:hypothetical protein
MRVPAFYSPMRGMALTDVWHDNSECPIGQSIAPTDRIAGKDSIVHRCAYCALLDKPLIIRHLL